MKNHIFKKIAAVFCAVMLTLSASPSSLSVENSADGGIVSHSLDLIDADAWSASDEKISVAKRTTAGASVLYVFAPEDSGLHTFSLVASFDSPLDLSGESELAMGVTVNGEADLTISILVTGNGTRSSGQATQNKGETGFVYASLGDTASAVDSITVTVECGGTASFLLTSFSSDNGFSYSYAEKYMSADVIIESGGAVKTADGITLPKSGEQTTLGFDFLYNGYDAVSAVYITVSGAASGSVSAAAAGSESVTDAESDISASSAQALYQGENTYVFIVSGEFTHVSFTFDGYSGSKESDGTVKITGAGACRTGTASKEESAGTITSCKAENGTVTVTGTLSPEAAVEYMDCTIALYVIPVWEDEESVMAESPAATAGFSTKFELHTATEQKYTNCLYKTVLLTDDGSVPVDTAVFADCGAIAAASAVSVTALHGADAAGIFESDVSSVIIDVYTGKLLETEDIYSAHLYTYGQGYYYFDNEYISSLDRRINFCLAAGTKVYLRIFSGTDGESFDYSPSDSGSVSGLLAASEFLASRFKGCAGFIMGSRLNAEAVSPSDAENVALLAAMFAETVKSSCQGALAIVPVGDGDGTDAAVFTASLAYYLDSFGSGSVSLLYQSIDGTAAGVYTATHLDNSFGTYGLHTTDGSMLMWEIPTGMNDRQITDSYREICKAAGAQSLRAAVLSVKSGGGSPELYNSIKRMLDDDDIFTATISQFDASLGGGDFSAKYPLRDFTSSYDTSGWIAGGGFSDAVTSASHDGTHRVLKASVAGDNPQAGIIVSWLDKSINLSKATIELSLALYSDADRADSADICVIFGGGTTRSEYNTEIGYNTNEVISCDMHGFDGAASVEYIAIIVRGAVSADLEFSGISVCSNEKSEEQLAEAFAAGDNGITHNPLFYGIIGVVAAATVAVWAFLARRKQRK